jgi:plasmid stabilization system protein ParE
MYRPILLPLAKQDIAQAAHWYNSKQKGLGKRFVAELRGCVKYICQNPYAVGIRYDNTRCVVLDVFPFMIHFHTNESKKLVIVSAVFHTSLDPENWKQR